MTEQKKCKDGWNGATRKGTKGGVLLNKLGQVLQKNKWKIGIGVIAMVLCVSGVIASNFWRAQAVDPKASIVAYGDKSETNLRVSQLLEVVTENMEAPLTYEYSVDSEESGRLYVGADSPTMVSGQSIYGDSRYLYAKGNTGWTGTIRVTVTDRDGKTARCKYENLEKANLTKDLKSTAYGIFEGEQEDLRQVIENAGVLHVNCANTSVIAETVTEGSIFALESKEKEYPVSGGKIKTKYCMIEATAEPEDTKEQKVSVLLSKKGCSYHGTTDGSAGVSVRIFKKPTLNANSSVGAHSVTLTGGEEGVVYYINGQGKKWENGTTELEFNNLQENTTYSVACTYTYQDEANKDKTAVAYTEIKTPEEVVVNFDTRGIGTAVESKTVIKGETITVPTGPTADGYIFAGWYRDLARTQQVEFPANVDADTIYYAKWTKRGDYQAIVKLKKDGNDWTEKQTVTLYDKGACAYTPGQVESTNTYKAEVYQGTYQVYVNGRYSGQEIEVDADGGEVTLNYHTIQANIKVDNTAKTRLSVKCVHKKGTQEIYREDCSDNNGTYTTVVPALQEGESYEIYAEGRLLKIIEKQNMNSNTSIEYNLNGYTVTITLQKDGSDWAETDGKVSVALKCKVEGTTIVADCEQDKDHKEQYKTVIWGNGDYNVYVKGTDSMPKIPDVTINKDDLKPLQQTVSYYTVTAYKGVSEPYDKAGSWILRSGDTLEKPKASLAAVDKKNFLKWTTDKEGTTDVFSGNKKTIEITEQTNLYAQYQKSRVLIGDYVKKADKTWTMPNLVIQGMDTVKTIVLETDQGKINVSDENSAYTTTSVDKGTYVTITFKDNGDGKGVDAAAAQAVLRNKVTITGVENDAQNTIVSVYSN